MKVEINFNCPERCKPKRPKRLWFVVVIPFSKEHVVAKKATLAGANVTANWTPSITPSVKTQSLQVTINGNQQPLVALGANDSTYTFQAQELDVIHVELWCNDGALDSAHTTADLTIPEITAPAAPTNLSLSWAPLAG